MRSRTTLYPRRQRAAMDAAVNAYAGWRTECEAVESEYRRWRCATLAERPLAFDAYRCALRREERVADVYARLVAFVHGLRTAPRSSGLTSSGPGHGRKMSAPRSIARDRSAQRTAFVLSGGASLGALQVGMLQALYEREITPDLLVATSVGAVNAAFVASRPQTVATARELASLWRNLEREDVFPVSMSALVGGLCGRRDHLVPDLGLREIVRRHIELDDLADGTVPLHVAAFDIRAGRETLLSEGPALEAIVAAASIPGVFPAVEIAGRWLVEARRQRHTDLARR